jgi:hypothetical protein
MSMDSLDACGLFNMLSVNAGQVENCAICWKINTEISSFCKPAFLNDFRRCHDFQQNDIKHYGIRHTSLTVHIVLFCRVSLS